MEPHMTACERALFENCLGRAGSYMEFGAGGSTLLADRLVKGPVYCVESDPAWIEKMRALSSGTDYERRFIFADIGPTGRWGRPLKAPGEVDYRNYHEHIWNEIGRSFDLYLIDGRFRVACFCQALLRAGPEARLMVHDYRSRPHYHALETVAAAVSEVEDLTVFARRPDASDERLRALIDDYANVVD
ncbi:hypothetical protein [Ancylobacter amanitiformis]|uniref:Class I SAM-dependent methyltransferase n=1 Tax=Ancylobacter amanitiformis TaxID=217069 RepID=A0ABU0LTZ7_9HYPH|nr:hypothetical protein [Ancylobacter amanitiformis]MDQ0512187.1 hypothetical protein [Ancylobacter amanitiformis]